MPCMMVLINIIWLMPKGNHYIFTKFHFFKHQLEIVITLFESFCVDEEMI